MKGIEINATIVFHKNWSAINELTADGARRWRYIINTGSSRSSKTYSLIDCYDLYARSQRNKRLTVWRDTKKSCKDTVLVDAKKRFAETGRYDPRNFNITDSVFKYPQSNSTFEIHGTDDEVTVHGLTQDAAWLNEPYKISRELFDQIDQRTTDFILIDWNPRKAHWIEDLMKDPRTLVIHSTFNDNSFCPPEQRKKILSYQPVSMTRVVLEKVIQEQDAREYNTALNVLNLPERDIKELARCQQNEFQKSASEYNWSVYGLGTKAEKPHRIYHFEKCSLQTYMEIDAEEYHYTDWGVVDPWAIGSVKYKDGCLYVREKNYASENETKALMSEVELALIGPATEEGLISWKFARLGIGFDDTVICDSNRPAKIRALRQAGWEYAVATTKGPNSVIDGIAFLTGLKVYYTEDSKNIAYENENYSREVDRYGVVQEEPEDIDNHHMDGIRYVATFLQSEGIITKI